MEIKGPPVDLKGGKAVPVPTYPLDRHVYNACTGINVYVHFGDIAYSNGPNNYKDTKP